MKRGKLISEKSGEVLKAVLDHNNRKEKKPEK
jgi:hypothetical protein